MPKKILLWAWFILLIFQGYVLAYVIGELQWPGPVQDFWGSIHFIDKTLSSGNWFGADLWVSQNNHRLVLPRLSFLVDYRFFHGSNYFLTALSLLLLILKAVIFYFLTPIINSKRRKLLIYFPALTILLLPIISYNFLNTFNIQWLQCAFLALLSCAAYSYGLESGHGRWKFLGLTSAILCCFTTFSLTAIWPALFLLLWLHSAPKNQWLLLTALFISFSLLFIRWLPVDKSLGIGSEYQLPHLLDAVRTSDQSFLLVPFIAFGLLQYLVVYFSFPLEENWQWASYFAATISLLFFAIIIISKRRLPQNWRTNGLVAVMFFVVCLGITTGIGRGFIGELSHGIRFYPIVLIYWAAFILLTISYLNLSVSDKVFMTVNIFCLVIIYALSIFDAKKTTARLSEEHNRFVKMQMAYITDNLGPNALYEALVAEWRKTSYPGILSSVSLLKNNGWGIFHNDIWTFLSANPSIPEDISETCIRLDFREKARNNDDEIRNITLKNADPNLSIAYPYVLIYSNSNIIGAAFAEKKSLFGENKQSVWIGMAKYPKGNSVNYIAVAIDETETPCLVKIQER